MGEVSRRFVRKVAYTWLVPSIFDNHVKSDTIDNNICETFNGVMVKAKSKPVNTMLQEIRRYVISRIVTKRKYAAKWKIDLGCFGMIQNIM